MVVTRVSKFYGANQEALQKRHVTMDELCRHNKTLQSTVQTIQQQLKKLCCEGVELEDN